MAWKHGNLGRPLLGVAWLRSAVVTRRRMVPEPRRDPTAVGCDPHPGAASVARKRVPACRPVVGVAAKVATWSPSSHGPPRGFPKPPERSISDRLPTAARSPLRAISRRAPGGALTACDVRGEAARPGPFCPTATLLSLPHGWCPTLASAAVSFPTFFQKQAGRSPQPPLSATRA